MKEKRWKVGDTITFKDSNTLPNKKYYYGGNNNNGMKTTIIKYIQFNNGENCYRIKVTTEQHSYAMLESEFIEWDTPITFDSNIKKVTDFKIINNEPKHTFSVGDKVTLSTNNKDSLTWNIGEKHPNIIHGSPIPLNNIFKGTIVDIFDENKCLIKYIDIYNKSVQLVFDTNKIKLIEKYQEIPYLKVTPLNWHDMPKETIPDNKPIKHQIPDYLLDIKITKEDLYIEKRPSIMKLIPVTL
jgi:hypothetical protein